jgi:ATP-dependent exoDNAse (exonuclease V) beta subunit
MAILFLPQEHKYINIDPSEKIEWTSVTSVISKFKEPFDADTIAAKAAKNKKSKWYGLDPEVIKEAWKNESLKAVNLGSWYHNQREKDLLACSTISVEDCIVPIVPYIEKDGIKQAPLQKLENGIYPEHMVYLKSAGICGQADRVEVINGVVNIYDYKTNKEIKSTAFTNWEGISKKMLPPVNHLDDCNLNHYNIQLSIYMYIILKHNPKLKAGKLVIEHIQFKEAGRDAYDNRVVLYDDKGEPVVDKIVQYHIPFLKEEVISIINYLKDYGTA